MKQDFALLLLMLFGGMSLDPNHHTEHVPEFLNVLRIWAAPHGHRNHFDPESQDPHLPNLPSTVQETHVRLSQHIQVVTHKVHFVYMQHMLDNLYDRNEVG